MISAMLKRGDFMKNKVNNKRKNIISVVFIFILAVCLINILSYRFYPYDRIKGEIEIK